MSTPWLFTVGLGALLALGYGCGVRLRAEYRMRKEPSLMTVGMVWALYSIHFFLVFIAAVYSAWPFPLPLPFSLGGGLLLMTVGMIIYLASVVAFGSMKRLSGLDSTQLITSGIYRWSRNPQYAGWMLFLVGIALLRTSAMVLLLAAFYWVSFMMYLPSEEALLEHIYGDAYREYRATTHRYFGPPKGR